MFKGGEQIWREKQSGLRKVSMHELVTLFLETGMGSAIEIHRRYGRKRCSLPAIRRNLEQMVEMRWLAKSRVHQQYYYRLILPSSFFPAAFLTDPWVRTRE